MTQSQITTSSVSKMEISKDCSDMLVQIDTEMAVEVNEIDYMLKNIDTMGLDLVVLKQAEEDLEVRNRLLKSDYEINKLRESVRRRIFDVSEHEISDKKAAQLHERLKHKRENIKVMCGEARALSLENILLSVVLHNKLNLIPYTGGIKAIVDTTTDSESLDESLLTGKERTIRGAVAVAALTINLKDSKLIGHSVIQMETLSVKLSEIGLSKDAFIFRSTADLMRHDSMFTKKAEQLIEGKIKDFI